MWTSWLWGPICDSAHERYLEQLRLLVRGSLGVVSVTDFPPLPGGRRSQVGPSKNVCTAIEIFLEETESLTKARSLAVCSASWSVIELNEVQCFTSSLLSFSSEQLFSK